MKQRIFIAINLPLEIKQELWQIQKKIAKLPIKLVPVENLHITLVFLGNLWPEEIENLKQIIQRAGERHKKFDINLIKVCSEKNRLIWVEGESCDLQKMQKELIQKLGLKEERGFKPHITLARGQGKIEQEINLKFKVQSIDIMKSELRRSGAIYTKLWEYKLK